MLDELPARKIANACIAWSLNLEILGGSRFPILSFFFTHEGIRMDVWAWHADKFSMQRSLSSFRIFSGMAQ
jgi:hypothetical protein